jgi:fucose permease
VLIPSYAVVLSSLFIIGLGMAMLQVIILPLMREAGGEKHYAFYSVLSQIIFGTASFISPFVLTIILKQLSANDNPSFFIQGLKKFIPDNLPWSSLYLIFMLVFALMLIVISRIKFPAVKLKEEERAGTFQNYIDLLKKRQVILFFLGIVAYVGTEQGLANWMSQFLSTYHGVDPASGGASAVAWFWGLMSIGCLLGLIIVKLIDSKIMLRIFGVLAFITLPLALFGPADISIIAFPFCGFAISIMFSVVFSLALNSEEKHHGAFSGILCTGIFGGALIPFIIGWLGDLVGLRFSMLILFVTVGYIFSVSIWARPLVKNEIVKIGDLIKQWKGKEEMS